MKCNKDCFNCTYEDCKWDESKLKDRSQWYKQDNWLGIGTRVKCSECNKTFILGDVKNYCPNCGAKMVGPQESEVEE